MAVVYSTHLADVTVAEGAPYTVAWPPTNLFVYVIVDWGATPTGTHYGDSLDMLINDVKVASVIEVLDATYSLPASGISRDLYQPDRLRRIITSMGDYLTLRANGTTGSFWNVGLYGYQLSTP